MPTTWVRHNGSWVEVSTKERLVESFEGGDTSNYTDDTGAYTVDQTSPVFDGEYSLKRSGAGTAPLPQVIISTSGLNYYPRRGDTILVDIQAGTSPGQPGFLFGAIDDSNHYFTRIDVGNDTLDLYKRSGGSATLLDDTSVTLTSGTHYLFEVSWQDNDLILVRLLDALGSEIARASGTDGEFSDETGIGWYNGGGENHVYDYMRVI